MWHSAGQRFLAIRSRIPAFCASAVVAASVVFAQQPNSSPLTISAAVQTALQKYPSIPAAEEQVNAAVAGIQLARTNYLPSLNALGQFNRATRNNVFGLLFPQMAIPNMSGPVLGTNDGRNVWGSAVGVLVSWEPFDFGRRHALVESAKVARNRAELTTKRTQFDIATTTAAAFLTLLASEQTVRAAQAAVDRSQVLVRSITALVNAQLRPGADLSRANTELDAAETQLIQSQQAVDVARTALARYTGLEPKSIQAVSGPLLQLPSQKKVESTGVAANPVAQEQNALVQESQARLSVLEHTYRPTFDLQAVAYARGTGALPDGSTLGGWNGLAPNYFNAGVGFTVSFPAFSLFSIRAQEAQEAAAGRSASATYHQVLTDLQAQLNAAQATLVHDQRIAAETPKEVADARAGFNQANAQYRSGLTTIIAVADAQRLLAQAEIDDSLARLAVWRAMLQIQTVQGDISGFLSEASR